jgi:predicted nuclease of predicted toxin-antitoxin system
MRLLIDMNLIPLWVPFFAEQGFESIHWSSSGTFRARHARHGLRER